MPRQNVLLHKDRSDVEQRANDIQNPANAQSVENPQKSYKRFQNVLLSNTVDKTNDTKNNVQKDCKQNANDPRQTQQRGSQTFSFLSHTKKPPFVIRILYYLLRQNAMQFAKFCILRKFFFSSRLVVHQNCLLANALQKF